jgi:hypothetical protein
VKFRYVDRVLTTYQEIRDRIYQLARERNLAVVWKESTPRRRYLLLYDSRQIVVARTAVPVRELSPSKLARLASDLAGVFGEGWMNCRRICTA